MKSTCTQGVVLAVMLGLTSFATQGAPQGYLTDSSGEIVTNSYGDCWHSGYWQPGDAVIGCDGKTAPKVAAVEVVVAEPVPEPPPVVVAPVDVDFEGRVYFGFDESALSADAINELEGLVASIPDNARLLSISVKGYTDPIGTEIYNLGLSERRARAVARYLIDEGGMPADEVGVQGLGELDQRVSCEGDSGAALIRCLQPNRRAQIHIVID